MYSGARGACYSALALSKCTTQLRTGLASMGRRAIPSQIPAMTHTWTVSRVAPVVVVVEYLAVVVGVLAPWLRDACLGELVAYPNVILLQCDVYPQLLRPLKALLAVEGRRSAAVIATSKHVGRSAAPSGIKWRSTKRELYSERQKSPALPSHRPYTRNAGSSREG